MTFNTIEEACRIWVESFNAIPMGIIEKLMKDNFDELVEVTPPSIGDRVHIYNTEHYNDCGEIVETNYSGEKDLYFVELDGNKGNAIVSANECEIEREGYLPMWGTMWAFSDNIDNEWISGRFGENGLQLMADCGFRIYEQEDYGYIFGIDGCGYDFFEAHWIPLYKARGLHWHKESVA